MNSDEINPYRSPASDSNELLSNERREAPECCDVDLWRDHVVSIWVGNFPSHEIAEDYFRVTLPGDLSPISSFAAEFGFRGYRIDNLDVEYEDDPQPVTGLLERFAYSEFFAPAVMEAAHREGIAAINCIAALYHHDWTLAGSVRAQGQYLRFLGVYPCGKLTQIPWLDRLTARTDYPAGAFLAVLEALQQVAARAPHETLEPAELCDGLYTYFVEKHGPLAREEFENLALLSSDDVANVMAAMMEEQVTPDTGGFCPLELQGMFVLDDWFPVDENPASGS